MAIESRASETFISKYDDFGDTSTLADPGVISELIEGKKSLLGEE
ncbi:MAG: hypothetical protein ACOCWR_06290 [Oceanidesulfovibrio sp.]